MATLTNHPKIVVLGLGLFVLIGLNVWLFGSNFITTKQLLTAEQIHQHNQQLSQIANQASQFTSRLSTKPLPSEQVASTLNPLQHQADEIVLRLQTAEYPKSLNDEVEQSLKLAQVLSFTLHNYQLQPSTALSSANISQVFHQASINAANLNQ